MKAIWKEIKGYEGIYSVSNTGLVRAEDRKIKIRDFEREVKGHIKKVHDDCHGYDMVDLYKGDVREKRKVHRLVMETFNPVPNADELDVNHIDGNKKNNNLSNLEWCTRQENLIHAVNTGLRSQNIGLVAYKDGKEYHSNSIYSMYDILKDIEDIKCTRKTFGGNVCRAIQTGGIYYGYRFKKEGD